MGVFDWASSREWSQLDRVESCETVGEEEKEPCNGGPNLQVARRFHHSILGDIAHKRHRCGVENVSASFIQVTPSSAHDT